MNTKTHLNRPEPIRWIGIGDRPVKLIFQLIWCLFIFLIPGCAGKQVAEPPKPFPSDAVFGIDISNHQGEIDWSAVKEWDGKKLSFVYIKATEGATFIDKRYTQNFRQARQNNLLVGSYHYFRTTSEPKNQFENFTAVVKRDDQDLIPLVDVEEMKQWSTDEFHQKFNEFLRLVENHFGRKPMIYTVNSFYNRYLAGRYKDYPVFIGRYGKNSPAMKDMRDWTIWQFSESGRITGIQKPVDLDLLNSNWKLDDLRLDSSIYR